MFNRFNFNNKDLNWELKIRELFKIHWKVNMINDDLNHIERMSSLELEGRPRHSIAKEKVQIRKEEVCYL